MKNVFFILSILLVLFSCEKENNDDSNDDDIVITDPYELPWKTEFIHYRNFLIGSHGSGYELYYKDSLLKRETVEFEYLAIIDSMLVNDSILHLFFTGSTNSFVLTTKNGGYTWDYFLTGSPNLINFHFVNTKLTYCVTGFQNNIMFTGIGKSNLSIYHDTLRTGTHYILDYGTDVLDIDSTIIEINNNTDYIILFN